MANWLRRGLAAAGIAAVGAAIGLSAIGLSTTAPGIDLADCAAGYTGSPGSPELCVTVPGEDAERQNQVMEQQRQAIEGVDPSCGQTPVSTDPHGDAPVCVTWGPPQSTLNP